MALSAEAIRAGLATLPQELYDKILKETFTAPTGIRQLASPVTKRSRSYNKELSIKHTLKLLHISSFTRAIYATSYYGGGIFVFGRAHQHHLPTIAITKIVNWLRSLPQSHQNLIKHIVLHDSQVAGKGSAVQRFNQVNHVKDQISRALGDDLAQEIFLLDDTKSYGPATHVNHVV